MDFLRIRKEGPDYTAEIIAGQNFSDGASTGPRMVVGHFVRIKNTDEGEQVVIQISKEMQHISKIEMEILSNKLKVLVGPLILVSP